MKKDNIFSTSTQILESVYVPGDPISGMSKVNTKVIEWHFRISKILYCLEKITTLPKLWSISFIGNRSLFLMTQYLFYAMKEMDWWPWVCLTSKIDGEKIFPAEIMKFRQ